MSRLFSNGTEGYEWMAHWCDDCEHDHAMHGGDGPGCPIIAAHMVDGDLIPEPWSHREGPPFYFVPDVYCHAFEPCKTCFGGVDQEPDQRAAVLERIMESRR